MAEIKLKTTKKIVPMIYAYSTPEIARHNGWTKIGYTEQGVEKRLKQQTHTVDVRFHEEWRGNAIYEDGTGEAFRDTDFHAYLQKLDIEREEHTEWFHVNGAESKGYFYDLNPIMEYWICPTPLCPISYEMNNQRQLKNDRLF